MPPERRLVPRFAAEPPQEALPYGRWADRLRQELSAAFLEIDSEGEEPSELIARAAFSDQLAEDHPEWKLDVCDEEVGMWRGEDGEEADMTLVWGRPMVAGGHVVTAELGPATVDQCDLADGRFTLFAPDDYRGDTLEVALWDAAGRELARESLYDDDGEDDEAPAA